MKALPPKASRPGHWLFGPAYHARRDPLRVIPQWISTHGDIFRVVAPFGQATIIASPHLAQQVLVDRASRYQQKSRAYAVLRILMGDGLVTNSGESWRRQRKLVQPAFHRRRLDALFTMMLDRVEACAASLEKRASERTSLDVAPVLSQLTLDIIARAMFGTDVQGAAAEVSSHIATLNEFALRMLRQPWLFLLPRRIPTPFTRPAVRALRSMDSIVHGIIRARRTSGAVHDDLLGMLLNACEEDSGQGMTDEQLRDEVMTVFVAGHETTANAFAWLLYLVATHPGAEEKLCREIKAQWPEGGLTLEHLAAFPYARQVIEESLRFYPSIWSVGRRCTEDDELGGFRIPAGMNVVIPIFYFHRSERFWPEAARFDPDRFAPDRRPPPEPLVYFPFGAGPRSCIGNHFAMQELMLMTLVFFRRYRFAVEPGFEVTEDPLITLRPKHGLRVRLEPR
ncbi:MAG: cytochrome P450 [Verrucomicrobiales bacterium]|nr:cytochrome P450 [Verrucomicrobiales bacterium]